MQTPAPKITSGFMLLDVKTGRRALEKAVLAGKRFQITVTAFIEEPSDIGRDDGTSIAFAATVTKLAIKPAGPA